MNVCCEVLIQQTRGRFYLHLSNVHTNVHFKQPQFVLNPQPHDDNSAALESEGRDTGTWCTSPVQNSGCSYIRGHGELFLS